MKNNVNAFEQAVEETPDIQDGYYAGLGALARTDRAKVEASNPRSIEGSVNIDDRTQPLYPDEPRWDYAIGYQGKVYFAEVHPANTCNIPEVEKKLAWLKQWLRKPDNQLGALPKGTPLFSWIATDAGVHIPATSPQYRRLAAEGFLPKRKLVLS